MTHLRRDRNLDVASEDYTKDVLFQSASGAEETVAIGIADAGAIYQMLSDLSANKGAYVLREAYSNAYDATVRAGDMSVPIEITIPSAITANSLAAKLGATSDTVSSVVVRDHGCGMDTDTVRTCFLQYGGSDKRDEIDAIGSKGLGSKAPLALADSFVVRTTKDGVTTCAIVSRERDTAGEARLTVEKTGEPSGTTVTIPVSDDHALEQMRSFADELLRDVVDVNLTVNGLSAERTLPTKVGHASCGYVYLGAHNIGDNENPCVVRVWEPDSLARARQQKSWLSPFDAGSFPIADSYANIKISVLIGGVRYDLRTDEEMKRNHIRDYDEVLVAVDAGWLDFTPSRDDIRDNQARRDFAQALLRWSRRHDYSDEMSAFVGSASAPDVACLLSRINWPSTTRQYQPLYGSSQSRASGCLYASLDEDGMSLTRYRHESPRATIALECLESRGITESDLEAPDRTSKVRLVSESAIQKDRNAYGMTVAERKYKKSDAKGANFTNLARPSTTALAKMATRVNGADGDTCLIMVSNVDTDERLRWFMNHTTPLRAALMRLDRHFSPRAIDYLTYDHEDSLPKWLRNAIATVPSTTLDFERMQELVKDEFRHRRSVAATARAAAASETSQDLGDLFGTFYAIPHGATSEELLAFASIGNVAFAPKMRASLATTNENSVDSYLEEHGGDASGLAFVIDPKGRSIRTAWLASLALLAKNTDLLDASVDTLLMLGSHVRQKQVQELLALGALCVFDGRTNVKGVVEDQLVTRDTDLFFVSVRADCPICHLSLDAAFGDDHVLKDRWAIMQVREKDDNVNQIVRLKRERELELRSAALVYDILRTLGRHDLTDPVDFVFGDRMHVSQKYTYNEQDVLWVSPALANNAQTTNQRLGYSGAKLDPNELANVVIEPGEPHDVLAKRTIDAYIEAIRPLTSALTAPGSCITKQEDVDVLAGLIGAQLAYTVEKALKASA